MSDAERDPSVLVSARLADHAKLILLPNDAARWGWVKLLGRAKLRRPAGEFPNVIVLAHDLGPHARYIDAYLTAGLLERRPEDILVVHDWGRHQGRRSTDEVQSGEQRTRKYRDARAAVRDANVTLEPSIRDAPVTPASRARASALSPSLSQSVHNPERNGTAEAAREPEDPAIDYLASVGAHVRADGNGVHRKLVELVRRRGIETVMATLADLHEQDFAASGRQLVFGAENALDQPKRPTPIGARRGHTRSSEETAGAWET